jgi:DNA/RNA endonuclease G (NUC1)
LFFTFPLRFQFFAVVHQKRLKSPIIPNLTTDESSKNQYNKSKLIFPDSNISSTDVGGDIRLMATES